MTRCPPTRNLVDAACGFDTAIFIRLQNQLRAREKARQTFKDRHQGSIQMFQRASFNKRLSACLATSSISSVHRRRNQFLVSIPASSWVGRTILLPLQNRKCFFLQWICVVNEKILSYSSASWRFFRARTT